MADKYTAEGGSDQEKKKDGKLICNKVITVRQGDIRHLDKIYKKQTDNKHIFDK